MEKCIRKRIMRHFHNVVKSIKCRQKKSVYFPFPRKADTRKEKERKKKVCVCVCALVFVFVYMTV